MSKDESDLQLNLADIDIEEMQNYRILSEKAVCLDFLDKECSTCSEESYFYCNTHSMHIWQRWRNKEHHNCNQRNQVENMREFKNEIEFDLNYFRKEVKHFWIIWQATEINHYNEWIYDMAEEYEKWIDNLKKLAESDQRGLLDTIMSVTELKKMKSLHTEIQKAIEWSSFSRADLLYCIKLMLEKLGGILPSIISKSQSRTKNKEDGKVNKLMKSFKEAKLPEGAIQLDVMPKLSQQVQEMVNKVKREAVKFPTSKLVFRNAVKLENGEYYEGQWSKEGVRHGIGTCIYPDGSVYEGFWEDDMRDGIGKYTTDKECFTGLYKENQMCDVGLYKYAGWSNQNIDDNEALDLKEKSFFNVHPNLWTEFGADWLVLTKNELNDIVINIPAAYQEAGTENNNLVPNLNGVKSLLISEDGSVYHITSDSDGSTTKQQKLYPKKKWWLF